MSWRLWNRLFGWHYAHVTSEWGRDHIGRAYCTADGRAFVEYGPSRLIFLDAPGFYKVTPLTWDPADHLIFGVIHQPARLPPPPRPSPK